MAGAAGSQIFALLGARGLRAVPKSRQPGWGECGHGPDAAMCLRVFVCPGGEGGDRSSALHQAVSPEMVHLQEAMQEKHAGWLCYSSGPKEHRNDTARVSQAKGQR